MGARDDYGAYNKDPKLSEQIRKQLVRQTRANTLEAAVSHRFSDEPIDRRAVVVNSGIELEKLKHFAHVTLETLRGEDLVGPADKRYRGVDREALTLTYHRLELAGYAVPEEYQNMGRTELLKKFIDIRTSIWAEANCRCLETVREIAAENAKYSKKPLAAVR